MLKRVSTADEELEYTLNVLYDASLLRSGYDVDDSTKFAKNVEKIVRANLKVSEEAEAVVDVKPAPAEAPIDESAPVEDDTEADAAIEDMLARYDGLKTTPKAKADEAKKVEEEAVDHDEL